MPLTLLDITSCISDKALVGVIYLLHTCTMCYKMLWYSFFGTYTSEQYSNAAYVGTRCPM